jgi:hypothetical protein
VVGLDLNGSQDIEDLAGNTLPSSEPTTDQTYLIDNTAPSIDAIIRADANPTSSSSVDFTVTFSEVVTGVDATDFSLATTGVVGASVIGVSGSGDTYTVSVNTGTGDGTIRLDVTDDNSIIDAASNALGGTGVGDGDFTSGEVYNVIKPATIVVTIGGEPLASYPNVSDYKVAS